jgi:hypothetical protein
MPGINLNRGTFCTQWHHWQADSDPFTPRARFGSLHSELQLESVFSDSACQCQCSVKLPAGFELTRTRSLGHAVPLTRDSCVVLTRPECGACGCFAHDIA